MARLRSRIRSLCCFTIVFIAGHAIMHTVTPITEPKIMEVTIGIPKKYEFSAPIVIPTMNPIPRGRSKRKLKICPTADLPRVLTPKVISTFGSVI